MEKIKLLKEHAKELTVLYVEDEELIRSNTAEFLRLLFKRVDEAADGELGLDQYLAFKKETGKSYDTLISDINMPNMNGITMCKEILDLNPEQAIVIMSAHDDSASLFALINLKIDHFLMKPIIHADVINVLFKLCRELNDYKLLKHYYQETEALSNELAQKNIQLETTVRFYKDEIERLKQGMSKVKESAPVKGIKMDNALKDIRYTQNDKIDAHTFIQTLDDSVIGKVEGFTHELDRLALLIYDIEDTDAAVTEVKIHEIIDVFNNFTDIIDTLVTFPVMVRALQSFTSMLGALDTDFGEEASKRKLFMTLLLGIVKDLKDWMTNIFIEKTTDDIHYFDALFANNLLEIEALFSASEIESDDGLESF